MHNLYGNRKLLAPEIKGSFVLSNGMFCVWGKPEDEGYSVDIYDNQDKKLLIGLEHNIKMHNCDEKDTESMLNAYVESIKHELEDSMVYYFGPRECTFEDKDRIKPIPKKTGRFA